MRQALYRRGLALTRLERFDRARADLKQACVLEPKNREVRRAADARGHPSRRHAARTHVLGGGAHTRRTDPPPCTAQTCLVWQVREQLERTKAAHDAQRAADRSAFGGMFGGGGGKPKPLDTSQLVQVGNDPKYDVFTPTPRQSDDT